VDFVEPEEITTMSKLPFFAVLGLAACLDPQESPTTPESAGAATQNATVAMSTVATIAGPFATAPSDQGADGGATEDSVETNAMAGLDNPGCVSFAWSGLTASVTFDNCMTNGHTLSGTIRASVALAPKKSIRLDLEQLTYDARSIDGFIALSWTEGALGIDADLTNAQSEHLAVTDFTIAGTASTIAVSGSVSGDDGNGERDLTASAVTFLRGDCSPSSGSLAYFDGTDTVTATFLPTTPADGIVEIQIGAAPAVPVKALPVCR
jgi:hypothetical protein